MTRQKIIDNYSNLLKTYSNEDSQLSQRFRKYGIYRIFFFLIWVTMVFVSTSWSWIAFGTILLIGMIIFVWLVSNHNRMHRRKTIVERLIRINNEEKNVMDWEYSDLDDGKEYMDDKHLYSYDLDIFGSGSLYQYINRTSTKPGKDRLAEMLSSIEKSKTLIEKRQEAVSELTPLLDWRQDFRAENRRFND